MTVGLKLGVQAEFGHGISLNGTPAWWLLSFPVTTPSTTKEAQSESVTICIISRKMIPTTNNRQIEEAAVTSCDVIKMADVTYARLAEPLLCPRMTQCSIHRHPFFQDLSDQDLASLCQRSSQHTFGTSEMLCREGDAADRFFIVLSGSVKLFRVTDQGNERVLGSVGAGEVLAEVAACSPEGRYPWYAQCLEPTRVRSFSGSLLREMVAGRSEYMMNVMRYVAAAMSQTVEDRTILTAQNARERLVQYLLSLIPAGAENKVGQTVELPLPKGLLASQLAMQPETLSRVLRELRGRELVQIDQRRVTILDPVGLRELRG